MEWLAKVFTKFPDMAVYLAIGIGYVIGRPKFRGVGLGVVIGSGSVTGRRQPEGASHTNSRAHRFSMLTELASYGPVFFDRFSTPTQSAISPCNLA